MPRFHPVPAAVAVIAVFAATAVPATARAATARAATARAATGQSAVVTTDCTSGRIQETVVNRTSSATTFTLTWPGMGTWTANVAAGDSSHFYFTKPSGTAYTFRTTTPQGLDQTDTGTLDCSDALTARAAMDCGDPHRLRLILGNRSPAARTFTVAWPGRAGSPWSVNVPASSGDDSLLWTVPDGTPYTFQVSSGGWSRTVSGTSGCGLGSGRPGMNAQTVLTTSTVVSGLGKAAKSVRIPALAVANDGTVIATMDARVDGSYDLGGGTNNIQVAMVRSTDGGATFSTPKIIAHAPTASEGYGDPSLLVDRTTGKIFCFFTYSPGPGVGYYGSTAGDTSATATTNTHIRYVTSTDGGATWSAATDLNPQVRNASWAGMFASSGHGVQLNSGRLVQPIVYHDSSGDHASNIYSDDHGATWHNGTTAGTGVNENKIIQRSTGRVAQNMRSNAGGNRWYATAADVTAAYGTAWNSGLIDPGCNGDEISYALPSSGTPPLTDTALHSNNAATGRTDLTVRLSRDDGSSWPQEALLKPGTAGYSAMAVLADGSVGDLYEIGDTGGIVFTRFTLPWLAP
ncbi:sialidase family protein [Actinomadura montaniterrae]|uniref:exo-alpha-sialidase n=1 Tax=Actinomadura montaniterrae TaxID=1803903 RepID=A0A6L3W096_9ACTN|nr:sialidase family protein [Actinomadura montaniterrae]KAB2379948.1 exo-alpha-sialidase [Actinomadura montaniterrae]